MFSGIRLTLRVGSALGHGEAYRLEVYVMDLLGDTEAQMAPITVGIAPSDANPDEEFETSFDLTPSDAEALRDFLDLLLRTKPWADT